MVTGHMHVTVNHAIQLVKCGHGPIEKMLHLSTFCRRLSFSAQSVV